MKNFVPFTSWTISSNVDKLKCSFINSLTFCGQVRSRQVLMFHVFEPAQMDWIYKLCCSLTFSIISSFCILSSLFNFFNNWNFVTWHFRCIIFFKFKFAWIIYFSYILKKISISIKNLFPLILRFQYALLNLIFHMFLCLTAALILSLTSW